MAAKKLSGKRRRELIRKLLEDALPQIKAQVHRYILPPEANDVVNEVALAVLTKADRFRPRCADVNVSFRRWVAGITKNKRREYFARVTREGRRTQFCDEDQLNSLCHHSDLSVESKLKAEDIVRAIHEVLSECSLTLREVALRYFWGMSIVEIAEELRMSRNAVDKNLSRVRQKLTAKLGDLDSTELREVVYVSNGDVFEALTLQEYPPPECRRTRSLTS